VIQQTRLNGQPIMVNADLIESVEPTPDTVITLVSGNKLIVRDSMDDIERRIVAFKRKIYGPPDPSTSSG
jgi:flagellar protein FlbD